MKNIFLIIFCGLFCLQLIACTPVIVIGATAGAGVVVATDRRKTDRMVEDQSVEMQISDYIYSSEVFGKKVQIAATSYNGTVLLTGSTPEEAYKIDIIKRVERMRPVIRVIDKIEVGNNLNLADRTNDSWITTKAKTNILIKKGVLSHAKVITSRNHIYLMGIVTNKEAKEIVNQVERISDAENITPLFEALDDTLETQLSADTHIYQAIKPIKTVIKDPMEDEDKITVQPFIIQPAIKLSDDN